MTQTVTEKFQKLAEAKCQCYKSLHDCGYCGGLSIRFSGRPCPAKCACQGTGRALPGLSEECPHAKVWRDPSSGHGMAVPKTLCHPDCLRCSGSGRIPLRHDRLEAIETALNGFGEWGYEYCPEFNEQKPHEYTLGWTGRKEYGEWVEDFLHRSDRFEAAIDALFQSAEAKGLVS